MSVFCSSGETYADVAKAKRETANNRLVQERTLQWWTSNDEVKYKASRRRDNNSEDDEGVIDLTNSDNDDNDNTTNNKKKNKRNKSLEPPKKKLGSKSRSKSLDPGPRNSKSNSERQLNFTDEDIEYSIFMIEHGIHGADSKFVWNQVMFKCKYCSKPAIAMQKIPLPDPDVQYYPDHCARCALEHIRKEDIIERAATCGHNKERHKNCLSCYDCKYYTDRLGKLCGHTMDSGTRVGCGKSITPVNRKKINDKNLCDGCYEDYLILTGIKQRIQCKCCGYWSIHTVTGKNGCDGSRMQCPNEHAGKDGKTKCSDLCQNVIQVGDVWWRCSGNRKGKHRYCSNGRQENKCKNDNPNARSAAGFNSVYLLTEWNQGEDTQMPTDYKTVQETTPPKPRYKDNRAKLFNTTPWDYHKPEAK